MSPRKTATNAKKANGSGARAARGESSKPSFPYTTRPAALRKFLAFVPQKPKPPRVDRALLASWGIKGGDAPTIIRVLKALRLVSSNGEATDLYTAFMHKSTGATVLAQQIREVYAPLFHASLEPYREPQEAIKNLFNIHSGGASGTIGYQIQTFKALSEYADFSGATPPAGAGTPGGTGSAGNGSAGGMSAGGDSGGGSGGGTGGLGIHIDLHIHLPEGKTSRDYQYIIQDIARFIYRHPEGAEGRERE